MNVKTVRPLRQVAGKKYKKDCLMNIRLNIALSDVTGLSGMGILEAIVQGERSGEKPASLVQHGKRIQGRNR